MIVFAVAYCPVLFGDAAAAGRDDAGSIWGVVTDELGGLLPGVTVTARHAATGLARSAVTGNVGSYEIARLPPGAYEVTAVLPGFRAAAAAATVAVTAVPGLNVYGNLPGLTVQNGRDYGVRGPSGF